MIAKSVTLTLAFSFNLDSEKIISLLSLLKPPPAKKKKIRKDFSLTIFLPFQLALPFLTAKEAVTLFFVKKSCIEILGFPILSKCLLE